MQVFQNTRVDTDTLVKGVDSPKLCAYGYSKLTQTFVITFPSISPILIGTKI